MLGKPVMKQMYLLISGKQRNMSTPPPLVGRTAELLHTAIVLTCHDLISLMPAMRITENSSFSYAEPYSDMPM